MHYDPLLRVVKTVLPDGHFTKVEFTPWEIKTFDQNDNFDNTENLHFNTPSIAFLDTLGRQYKVNAYLTNMNTSTGDDILTTETTFNISGKPLTVTDPRKNIAFEYLYDMQEQILRTKNIDSGNDMVFADVMGKPVKSFDAKGHEFLSLMISFTGQ